MKKFFILPFTAIASLGSLTIPSISTSCSNSTFQISKCHSLIELHNHIEGALSLDGARRLSAAIQNDSNITEEAKLAVKVDDLSDEELAKKIQVEKNNPNLTEFLSKFTFIKKLLIRPEGFKVLVKEIGDYLYDQGVIYAELRMSPQSIVTMAKGTHIDGNDPTLDDYIKAAIDGVELSKLTGRIGLIISLKVNETLEEHRVVLEAAKKYKSLGICGIDIAGDESSYPLCDNEGLKTAIKEAKAEGFNITLHAGESEKKDSGNAIKNIKTAVNLGAKRIGHCTYAQTDEATMNLLVQNSTTIEACPYSNYMTKGVAKYEDHPIKKFLEYNIPVCLSTDDPGVENISLHEEWQRAIDTFGFTKTQVEDMMVYAANAAFIDEPAKRSLVSAIHKDFNSF